MKRLIFFSLMFLLPLLLRSQVIGGKHEKLAKFYEEERWEDCAFKADRMILLEKYQNDAEVYLYLAASYNKIFLMCLEDSTLLYKVPDYLKAYTYALKYSVTAKKKDKKRKELFPKNNFLLEEIAIAGIHYVDHFISIKKYSKANSYTRKIIKTYKDPHLLMLQGVLTNIMGDTVTGNGLINSAYSMLDAMSADQKAEAKTAFIMIDAVDLYAGFLSADSTKVDSAKNFVTKALVYYPDNKILQYDMRKLADPTLSEPKPENEQKAAMLKQVMFNTQNEADDDDDGDDD